MKVPDIKHTHHHGVTITVDDRLTFKQTDKLPHADTVDDRLTFKQNDKVENSANVQSVTTSLSLLSYDVFV